jgi:hypothetical protein
VDPSAYIAVILYCTASLLMYLDDEKNKLEFSTKYQHRRGKLSKKYQPSRSTFSKKYQHSRSKFSKKYQYSESEFIRKYQYSKNVFSRKCQYNTAPRRARFRHPSKCSRR